MEGEKEILWYEPETKTRKDIKLKDYKISCIKWFNRDYLVVGTANGIVVLLSMKKAELGMEVTSFQASSQSIECIAVNPDLSKLAVAVMG